MEEFAPLPDRSGWYCAWGSAPWSWMYFARIDGRKVTYFVLKYDPDKLRKRLIQLREQEVIHTFTPLDQETGQALDALQAVVN